MEHNPTDAEILAARAEFTRLAKEDARLRTEHENETPPLTTEAATRERFDAALTKTISDAVNGFSERVAVDGTHTRDVLKIHIRRVERAVKREIFILFLVVVGSLAINVVMLALVLRAIGAQ